MLARTKFATSLVCSLLASIILAGQVTAISGNQVTFNVTCDESSSGIRGSTQMDITQPLQAQQTIKLNVGTYFGASGNMVGNTFMPTSIFYAQVICQ